MKKNNLQNFPPSKILLFLLLLFFLYPAKGAEVCDWSINTCPENLNDQVITVPPSVVSLSPHILTCGVTQVIEGVYTTSWSACDYVCTR